MNTRMRNSAQSFPFLSEDDRGSILVLALFVLCLLTVFCVYLGYGVRQKLALVSHLETRQKLRLAVDAGIKMGIAVVREEEAPEDLIFRYGDGTFSRETEGGTPAVRYYYSDDFCEVRAAIEDENGKININKADSEVMRVLFQNAADLDEALATSIAFCIIDWRDANSTYGHAQYGAEDKDYDRPPFPYGAKDAEFEVLEELRFVKGVTDEIFDAVEGYLTIYGTGDININVVSVEVLLALGLSEELADKIILFREDGNEFVLTSSIVADLQGFIALSTREVTALNNLISNGAFTTSADYFKIRSVGTAKNKNVVWEIVSAVENDGTIVFWREE